MAGTVLQFPLSLGLAEDENPKQRPISALKTGANIRWPRNGQIGKRWGTETVPVSLSGGGNLSNIERFVLRGTELAIANSTHLHAYDATAEEWIAGPRLPSTALEWSTHLDPIDGIRACESAILSDGKVVDVWLTGDPASSFLSYGTLRYQIRDLATGVVTQAPTTLKTEVYIPCIRLVSSGTTWLVLLMTRTGDLISVNGSTETTLQTDAAQFPTTAPGLDAVAVGSEFIVAYTLNAGGIKLRRYTIANTPVQQTSVTVAGVTSQGIQALAIDARAGETLYIVYWDNVAELIRLACANPSTLAQTVVPTTVDSGVDEIVTLTVERSSSTSAIILASYAITTDAARLSRWDTSNGGALGDRQATIGLCLLSRIFTLGSRFYAFASTKRTAQTTSSDAFLIDVTEHTEAAPFIEAGKLDVFTGGWLYAGFVTAPRVYSSEVAYAAIPFQSTVSPKLFGGRQGARFVKVSIGDSVPADYRRSVALGQEAVIAAGVLTSYDGAEAPGYGWPHGPYLDTDTTVPANVSGSMANGVYLYNVTAERRSRTGLLYRAPMGVTITANVVVPNNGANIGIVTASLGGPTRIPLDETPAKGHYPLYRSEANGSVLYRLTIEPDFMTVLDDGDGTAILETQDDNSSSSVGLLGGELSERPQSYTDAGELEDVQPPGVYTLHMHQRRIGIITGGRREYWYSKDANEVAGVAPGFNPAQLELYDEDLTACASLDEKRIMFSERRIWFVVGDGPTVAGTDNRFSTPQPIQTDVGCTNARSIVSWPGGVMFQNGTDIYNLSRGLTVEWVGKDARDKLESYPNITSAVLVSSENEIRFTCNDDDGTAGIVLVFDYQRGTWMTRSYPSGAAIVDACLHGGTYYMATANTVRAETTSTHLDDSSFAPSTVFLSPIAPTGSASWHRVRRAQLVGTALSNHQLTIAIARDYSASTQQTKTFAAGSDVTTIGPLERAQVDLAVQKIQAVEIQISDAAPSNTVAYPLGSGAGFTLDGVALLVQPKTGLARITANRRG